MENNGLSKLAAALAKAQGAIEGARKDKKNEHFRSKYADLASCWDACREPLSANGLAVVQFPTEAASGQVGLRTILMHESGERIEHTFYMPVKDASNPQAIGSALTYARRYALCSVVGIAPEEDDGNAAAGTVGTLGPARPARDPLADSAKLEAKFAGASSLQAKKAVFQEARESGLPEAVKLGLMAKFSEAIRSASGK